MATRSPLDVRAPDASEYVLPTPPPVRNVGEVVVVAPRDESGRAWRRGGRVARALGERFLLLAESQHIFAEELRTRLVGLDQSIAEATKAQLKGAVRDLLAVLDWNDAVVADQRRTASLAVDGAEPIDVVDLCQDVAAEVQAGGAPVHVSGGEQLVWWGRAESLAEVVRAALALVAERSSAAGARLLTVTPTPEGIALHVTAHGEPNDQVEPATVARFRRAVDAIGGRVHPDANGPGGNGLVLELPIGGPAAG